jgi:two-component system, LuxR family, secretion system response regulator SsrB
MVQEPPNSFGLTGRELNLLRYLAAGFTARAAAERFGVSVNTIKARRRALLRKLQAFNSAHAVALGYEWGLLVVDPDARGPSALTTLGQIAAW